MRRAQHLLSVLVAPLTRPIAVFEGDVRRQAARRDREDQEAPQVRVQQLRGICTQQRKQPLTLHRREHGNKVVGEVTLDQVYGGARGIKSLVWEVRAQNLLSAG